ncbi:hypothetical protein [Thalassobacillus sp. C254]|uniref:hypothetical protein n=1 Tax=Thalassobacillus sp. C254 TaxID=1225341 RepID=UPI0012EE1DB1|nr:hypothetical protein [Thalassobacillus sp. C254]
MSEKIEAIKKEYKNGTVWSHFVPVLVREVECLEQRARRAEDELIYWKDKAERLERIIG